MDSTHSQNYTWNIEHPLNNLLIFKSSSLFFQPFNIIQHPIVIKCKN